MSPPNRAEAEHGTNARYVRGKCRCGECREAARVYGSGLRRRNAYAAWNPDMGDWVDACRAREHVSFLRSAGIGPKRIARVSGVPHGSLAKLIYGDPRRGSKPSKQIRRDTERRILLVSSEDGGENQKVGAAETWRQIEEMVEFGVPKARVARAIGQKTRGLQLSKDMVCRRSAVAVAKLHWGLFASCGGFRRVCRCPMPGEVAERLGLEEGA